MAALVHIPPRALALALALAAPAAAAPIDIGPPPASPVPSPAPSTPAPPATPTTPQPPAARAPRPTATSPVFLFRGRGFGHGVGMSQYGARGAALQGWDAGRILRWYYRGTQITQAPGGAVRIILASGRSQVRLSSAVPWQVVDETATPQSGFELPQGAVITASVAVNGSVKLARPGGAVVATLPGQARIQTDDVQGAVKLGAAPYRGALRLIPRGGSLDVVNVVDLEQYLGGVVGREMPAKWGDDAPAALEAQAIAARTYAVAAAKPSARFDMFADQRSQVYGGVAAEDPRTIAAVQATRGQVLTYNGGLITAYYFSTSGGRTESVQNVFSSTPVPYLVSVPDPFDGGSPYHSSWGEPIRVTGARLAGLFGLPAPVTSVRVLKRGASPRVLLARLVSRGGSRVDVTGAKIRATLRLRDTWFTVTRLTSRSASR